jgi:hypothetical protein
VGLKGSENLGYRWKISIGKFVKFLEDIWFGNAPLPVQFLDIYFVSNQQTQIVEELWDGSQVRGPLEGPSLRK